MLKYKSLTYIPPIHAFDLVKNEVGAIFLDSNMSNPEYGRYSFIAINPLATFSSLNNIDFNTELTNWKSLFSSLNLQFPELPPFVGGLAGYLSYDLSKYLEEISYNPCHETDEIPTYWMGLYNQVLAFDNLEKTCFAVVTEISGYKSDVDSLLNKLCNLHYKALNSLPTTEIEKLPSINLQSNFTQDEYIQAVSKVVNYILNGDVFEVNLAQKFNAELPINYPIFALYKKLQKINPAPFSAFLNLGNLNILSSSPERFISIRDRHIETRPIKGTIKKEHAGQNSDLDSAQTLVNSEKDRAENIMVVDMLRSDLSKICDSKSIHVTKLCGIESFTNLHHLVSVITGKLKDNCSIFDVIPACFPGASITGAPKVRSMQIIEELELNKRGVYCGSIGYFSLNGNVDLSIAIRTIIINQNKISFQVGGAITLDSDPLAEYQETLAKGEKLVEAINDISDR